MELQRQPPSSRMARSNRTLSSFVAFLALLLSRGEAFQLNLPHVPLRSCFSGKGACARSSTTAASSTGANSFPNSNSNNRNANRQGQQQQQAQQAQSSRRRSRSATTAYYSSSSDPPFSSSPDNRVERSFAERMRSIALKRDRQESPTTKQRNGAAAKSTINPHKPPFVHEAVSLAAFKALVADEHDAIVVVRFYAKWCKACKAAEPSFYRLARSMQQQEEEATQEDGSKKKNTMKFVEVPVLEENANLHQGLGVSSLPFAHIYSPTAGLVEELKMTKNHFKTFQHVVHSYRDGECTDLKMDDESGMFLSPYVAAGKVEEAMN